MGLFEVANIDIIPGSFTIRSFGLDRIAVAAVELFFLVHPNQLVSRRPCLLLLLMFLDSGAAADAIRGSCSVFSIHCVRIRSTGRR
jgi:hypothetical protein